MFLFEIALPNNIKLNVFESYLIKMSSFFKVHHCVLEGGEKTPLEIKSPDWLFRRWAELVNATILKTEPQRTCL